MKQSLRAKRMAKHHRRLKQIPKLNLVSLMDIFTILVFFLLVNSSNAPQLPDQKDLQLPTSIAQATPRETLLLAVTPESLLLQGRLIAPVAELLEDEEDIIGPLLQALENRQAPAQDDTGEERGRAITIMADENLPYDLVRKILATCQQAGFTEIAFAAHQKARPTTAE